jgi:hypothetical protein
MEERESVREFIMALILDGKRVPLVGYAQSR